MTADHLPDVPREDWQARQPSREMLRLRTGDLRGMVLHHTGSQQDEPQEHHDCAARVRATQRFHQQERGWADVAYHLLVCRHGSVFEGRNAAWQGAHAGGGDGNERWLGVAVLGDFGSSRRTLTPELVRGLTRARRFVLHRRPLAVAVWPHLRFRDTRCPGPVLREWCRRFP